MYAWETWVHVRLVGDLVTPLHDELKSVLDVLGWCRQPISHLVPQLYSRNQAYRISNFIGLLK